MIIVAVEYLFNTTATVIILNAKFIDVNEISSTKIQTHCIMYSLFYNKKVYNLLMADIQAETCCCCSDKLRRNTS